MSISNIIIKIVGVVIILVGAALITSAVGLPILGASLSPWWLSLLVGLLLIGAGIWVVKGGDITI